MTARILLVEDDRGLRLTLTHRLASEGYEVQTAADGEDGLRRASSGAYDLILLDVMLPGKSGFEVCRELRRAGLRNARSHAHCAGPARRQGDGPAARCRRLPHQALRDGRAPRPRRRTLRQACANASARDDEHRFGDVVVDVRGTEVFRDGDKVELSAKEFKLLLYFLEHRGETLSREELLGRVWGYDSTPTTRTVDMHVAWLRRKLEPNPAEPQFILTVRGLGYKFVS